MQSVIYTLNTHIKLILYQSDVIYRMIHKPFLYIVLIKLQKFSI